MQTVWYKVHVVGETKAFYLDKCRAKTPFCHWRQRTKNTKCLEVVQPLPTFVLASELVLGRESDAKWA